ncbi:hypothetical protein FSP39_000869 [Pinctada imbricata]|uniref:Uncharacterized protein n=1 Tax=Pinctada imbricata TaxID=66713 RepID=A0AA89CBD6_PINIB|nr:hypothetical protein FSP39_000869 [Pinctada imbricata]
MTNEKEIVLHKPSEPRNDDSHDNVPDSPIPANPQAEVQQGSLPINQPTRDSDVKTRSGRTYANLNAAKSRIETRYQSYTMC